MKPVWIGFMVGSTIGGLIPNLWGASFFSFSSLFIGTFFGMVGMFVAFKMTQ